MKRILTLLIISLAWATFAAATPIRILSGFGTVYGWQEPLPHYSFTFYVGSSKPYFKTTTLADFFNNSGLTECSPCADPTNLGGLLFDHGIGQNTFGYYFGDIVFRAVSSKSKLFPNGQLIVDYKAIANIQFQMCTNSGCDRLTSQVYAWNGPYRWDVQALFKPDPNGGGYDFFRASFSGVVPEPSTFLMLGTGLLGILGAARRKLLG